MEPRERDRRRESPLPASLRAHLEDDADETATVGSLLAAAEESLARCAGKRAPDREMAFELLAVDVRVTRACQRALAEGGGAAALGAIASRIANLAGTGESAPS